MIIFGILTLNWNQPKQYNNSTGAHRYPYMHEHDTKDEKRKTMKINPLKKGYKMVSHYLCMSLIWSLMA